MEISNFRTKRLLSNDKYIFILLLAILGCVPNIVLSSSIPHVKNVEPSNSFITITGNEFIFNKNNSDNKNSNNHQHKTTITKSNIERSLIIVKPTFSSLYCNGSSEPLTVVKVNDKSNEIVLSYSDFVFGKNTAAYLCLFNEDTVGLLNNHDGIHLGNTSMFYPR